MIKHIEQGIQFEPYSGCFWCGVPQEICNRWEENGQGRYRRSADGNRQYQGVVLGGLMGIVYGSGDRVRERWAQRLVDEGVDGSCMEGLMRYLGAKQPFDCVESNRLVGEFCWITRLLNE